MSTNVRRTGRPAGGDGSNRTTILNAARQEFATKGFQGATMRTIAARAGFDVALVGHYFGSKDSLFAATIELPGDAYRVLLGALSAPQETQGERLTRSYFELWENAATGAQMRVLARSGLTSDAAGTRIGVLLTQLISASGLPEERSRRFALAMSQLLGIAITRYLTGLPAVAQIGYEDLVALVAPGIQILLEARK